MIDSHIHILPGLDDGSPNIDVSIKMASISESQGFTDVIATPHFILDNNEIHPRIIRANVRKLNSILAESDIKINVHCASEIYYTSDLLKLLEEKKVLMYCGTKYFLVELPIVGRPMDYIDVLSSTMNKGYIPIIAHPERYEWFEKYYNEFKFLHSVGVRFQINYGSISKMYGSMPQKSVIKLLKEDMVDLIGTDSHGNGKVEKVFENSVAKIVKICGRGKFEKMTITNPQNIIDNKEI